MRQGLVNGQFDQRISKHLVCLELPRLGWLKAIQGEEATAQLHSSAEEAALLTKAPAVDSAQL